MARIDVRGRVLELKLVYYGPALGGKTTNLRALHALLDPRGEAKLMSLDTAGDRTLFFDLLPLELRLGNLLRLKLRLFTVPGQIHYNATRRLVLQQADGVAFVVDSDPTRLPAGRDSLLSLDGNLTANGFEPGSVPIVLQANKRDLPDAASLDSILTALAPESLPHHASAVRESIGEAVALSSRGVLETFERLLLDTLDRVHDRLNLAASKVGKDELARAVEDMLAPARAAARRKLGSREPRAASRADLASEAVLPGDALLAESLRQSMVLAEALGDQHAERRQLARRVAELECLQRLSSRLGAARDAAEVAEAATEAAAVALPNGSAALLLEETAGVFRPLALLGREDEPLSSSGDPSLACVLADRAEAVAYADIDAQLLFGDAPLLARLAPACTLACAPLPWPDGRRALLTALGADPESPAGPDSTRFLSAVAGPTRLALEVLDREGKLRAHGESLENEVAERTAELRAAHAHLVAASRLKDRILSSVNHELRTPVTCLLSAAQAVERCRAGTTPPPQLMEGLVRNARALRQLLDQVLSAQSLLASAEPSEITAKETTALACTLDTVVLTSRERAAERRVSIECRAQEPDLEVVGEPAAVTLIVSQLLDNAIKFTRSGTSVGLLASRVEPGWIEVRVRDEGPGIADCDAERIFDEFDQGGGDPLVDKPGGLGLGLAIARRLARRLGGDVRVARSRDGRGALLVLRLPEARAVVKVG